MVCGFSHSVAACPAPLPSAASRLPMTATREWGDRLGEFFADVTIADMPGTGHVSPLEALEAFARAISAATTA